MESRLELALFVIASCTLQNEKTIAKDVMASAFDGGVQCIAKCQKIAVQASISLNAEFDIEIRG